MISPRDWSAVGLGVRRDAEIARELGVTREAVRRQRAMRSIPLPTTALPRSADAAWMARLVELVDTRPALSWAMIAKELGASEQVVRWHADRRGLTKPPCDPSHATPRHDRLREKLQKGSDELVIRMLRLHKSVKEAARLLGYGKPSGLSRRLGRMRRRGVCPPDLLHLCRKEFRRVPPR